jgi:hypothetical protein
MRRLLDSALRGAALVVTDRRWAAPLSAAALGFGIFAGVAIGPGAAGTLATGAQQIIEIPGSGGEDGQNGGGGGSVASAESAAPFGGAAAGGFEEALPATTSLAPEPVEPSSAPVPEPAAKPEPAAAGEAEAEQAEGQVLEGAVVHANSAAGSYTLAIGSGELVSIHAPQLPTPGTVLSAPTRRLANGTFAEAGELEEEKRMATKVSFRGAVTFADPDPVAPAYTVSGRGASLLVHVEPAPGGAAPELPPLGAYVTVTAAIEESEEPEAEEPRAAAATLMQREVEAEPGPPSTYLDLAGIVGEVLPEANQLLLSADDTRASEADLVLAVPKAIDATRLRAGDSYLATATVEPDGSLTLAGITSDERTKGASNTSSAQGDLKRAVANASSAGGTGEGGVRTGESANTPSPHDRTRG